MKQILPKQKRIQIIAVIFCYKTNLFKQSLQARSQNMSEKQSEQSSLLQDVANTLIITQMATKDAFKNKNALQNVRNKEIHCRQSTEERDQKGDEKSIAYEKDKDDMDDDNQRLKRRSNIFVWGNNSKGQLSLECSSATIVQDPLAVGNSLDQIRSIKSVACGAQHTLILSDAGEVFAFGDNSLGQLGIVEQSVSCSFSEHPIQVNGFGSANLMPSQVYCSLNSSFALLKAAKKVNTDNDELYAWGSTFNGILGQDGIDQSNSSVIKLGPSKIEFQDHQQGITKIPFRIQQVSVGDYHAALITKSKKLYCWGSNLKGQLGTEDTDNRFKPVMVQYDIDMSKAVTLVSCGTSFTFIVTDQNEIKVSGQLPFTIMIEHGQEQDYVPTFQSIAQFDQRVKILQIESSRFASIVVDPRDSEQTKELFFWGRSPVGIFNELTALNQLFENRSSESLENQHQNFDVKAVRNGANFCVFIDQQSGMTYQIGAENLIDPYIDDALVSLSELRDAQFTELEQFACGTNFVIGQSATNCHLAMALDAANGANQSQSRSLQSSRCSNSSSMNKKQLQNGDGTAGVFHQEHDADNNKVDRSPSKSTLSIRSITEMHKGAFKFLQGQINNRKHQAIDLKKRNNGGGAAAGCHQRVKSCVLVGQNKNSSEGKEGVELLNEDCSINGLNKTATSQLVTSQAIIAEEENEEDKPVNNQNNIETKTIGNNTSQQFYTQARNQYQNKQKSMSSPSISPINPQNHLHQAALQNQGENTMITASRVENEQYWIDGMLSYSVQETISIDNHLQPQIVPADQRHERTGQHQRKLTAGGESTESQQQMLMLKSPRSYVSSKATNNHNLQQQLVQQPFPETVMITTTDSPEKACFQNSLQQISHQFQHQQNSQQQQLQQSIAKPAFGGCLENTNTGAVIGGSENKNNVLSSSASPFHNFQTVGNNGIGAVGTGLGVTFQEQNALLQQPAATQRKQQQNQHHHCTQMTMGMPSPMLMESINGALAANATSNNPLDLQSNYSLTATSPLMVLHQQQQQQNNTSNNCHNPNQMSGSYSGFLAMVASAATADQQYQSASQQMQQCQSTYYEQVIRDKQETAQLQGQLMEAQRQLDKSRKEYGKLLSQLGKDKDEVVVNRKKIHELEASLLQKNYKIRELDATIEKKESEKVQLETDSKKQVQTIRDNQAELIQLRCKVQEIEQKRRNQCVSESCRHLLADSQAQYAKKSKEVYELTVKLGCLQSENIELKTELQHKTQQHENEIEEAQIITKTETQKYKKQLAELQKALNLQKKMNNNKNKKKLQTDDKSVQTKVEGFQTIIDLESSQDIVDVDNVDVDDDDGCFKLPQAVYEQLRETIETEIDETCDISLAYINPKTSQQKSLSIQPPAHVDNNEQQSLKEFQQIEQSIHEETRSALLDSGSRVLHGSAQRGGRGLKMPPIMINSIASNTVLLHGSLESPAVTSHRGEDQMIGGCGGGFSLPVQQQQQHNFLKNTKSSDRLSPKILRQSEVKEPTTAGSKNLYYGGMATSVAGGAQSQRALSSIGHGGGLHSMQQPNITFNSAQSMALRCSTSEVGGLATATAPDEETTSRCLQKRNSAVSSKDDNSTLNDKKMNRRLRHQRQADAALMAQRRNSDLISQLSYGSKSTTSNKKGKISHQQQQLPHYRPPQSARNHYTAQNSLSIGCFNNFNMPLRQQAPQQLSCSRSRSSNRKLKSRNDDIVHSSKAKGFGTAKNACKLSRAKSSSFLLPQSTTTNRTKEKSKTRSTTSQHRMIKKDTQQHKPQPQDNLHQRACSRATCSSRRSNTAKTILNSQKRKHHHHHHRHSSSLTGGVVGDVQSSKNLKKDLCQASTQGQQSVTQNVTPRLKLNSVNQPQTVTGQILHSSRLGSERSFQPYSQRNQNQSQNSAKRNGPLTSSIKRTTHQQKLSKAKNANCSILSNSVQRQQKIKVGSKTCEACLIKKQHSQQENKCKMTRPQLSSRGVGSGAPVADITPKNQCQSVVSLDEQVFSHRSKGAKQEAMTLQTEFDSTVFSSIDTSTKNMQPVIMSAREQRRNAPPMITNNLINSSRVLKNNNDENKILSIQTARSKVTSEPKENQNCGIDAEATRGIFKDNTNLRNIQDKLQIIQTGKMLLTQKIQEYESKLKTIQAESAAQIAICSSQRSSLASTKENMLQLSTVDPKNYESNFTLGDQHQQQTANDFKAEGTRQQINIMTSSQSSGASGSRTTTRGEHHGEQQQPKYRKCRIK